MTTICGYSTNEYLARVEKFHGHPAPGLLIGGFMVDMAMRSRPEGEFFDVLCETSVCLPDAVQLLTPCTYGNGWLKVVDIGRFAITVFEKYSGKGVRVHLDASKLDDYPEIKAWFFRLKRKEEQDQEKLMGEILNAGERIFAASSVQVDGKHVGKKKGGPTSLCPKCGEAYPVKSGNTCLACQGEILYK
jgi:formylmethanofuran dehydrogenase subunit E